MFDLIICAHDYGHSSCPVPTIAQRIEQKATTIARPLVVPYLSPAEISALSSGQVQAITADQLPALSSQQICAIHALSALWICTQSSSALLPQTRAQYYLKNRLLRK